MSARSAGLRNKPLDRRYLSDQDKADYNASRAPAKAQAALARTRAYKGQQSQRLNTPPRTQVRRPGSGGFGGGIQVQQQRLRKYGEGKRSDFQVETPSLKGDMFKKQN